MLVRCHPRLGVAMEESLYPLSSEELVLQLQFLYPLLSCMKDNVQDRELYQPLCEILLDHVDQPQTENVSAV